MGDPGHNQQAGIAPASFDSTHVGQVDPGLERQLFLGQPAGRRTRNKVSADGGRVLRHDNLATDQSVMRRDEMQDYQGQTTGRLAVAWELGSGFTLKNSWGQGFKAPSIFETTYPCFECAVPGPNLHLQPERAEGPRGVLEHLHQPPDAPAATARVPESGAFKTAPMAASISRGSIGLATHPFIPASKYATLSAGSADPVNARIGVI